MYKFAEITNDELMTVVGGKKKKNNIDWGKVGTCALNVGVAAFGSAATGNVPFWIASTAGAYLGSCR